MDVIERMMTDVSTPHTPLDPSQLSGTFGRRSFPVLPTLRRAARFGQRPRRASTFGTLLSDILGSAPLGQAPGRAPLSGTSVIVQGALVARTMPRGQAVSSQTSPENGSSDAVGTSQSAGPSTSSQAPPSPNSTSQIPQTATLEEQGEMLGRILRIAAAATAASVVGAPSAPSPAPASASAPASSSSATPETGAPAATSERGATAAPTAPVSADSSSSSTASPSPAGATSSARDSHLGRDLLERLLSPHQGPSAQRPFVPDTEAISMISRLMREALRASLSSRGQPEPAAEPTPAASSDSLQATLEQARSGLPPTPGEPGSFDRFLHDLLEDLNVAMQRLGEETELEQPSPASEAEAEQSNRREGDVVCGQLSFFRLFRFDRHESTSLIPCILVGVRSLRADERLMGEIMPQGDQQGRGLSRLVLFVSGGRYHDEHPLLTAHPREAGRDLMFMMELLGTMSAMQFKRPTASANDIARSGLSKVCGSELPALLEQGAITENTSEKLSAVFYPASMFSMLLVSIIGSSTAQIRVHCVARKLFPLPTK
ncbi:hypothetical protein MNAN1_001270 [Malassezia nana]|uniref:Uncharacterized protein n=1 Tax=Malassezia nana TaxID=180528 RepID=A0AAF0EIS8_9BASI|nr:hypothetical protein MNAN1_001270 [Malassezia nana]